MYVSSQEIMEKDWQPLECRFFFVEKIHPKKKKNCQPLVRLGLLVASIICWISYSTVANFYYIYHISYYAS